MTSKGVNVDLGELSGFATKVGRSADQNQTNATATSGQLANLGQLLKSQVMATDGTASSDVAVGFLEAQDFAIRHGAMAESAQQFMAAAMKGMISLSSAAETCAARYASTDQQSTLLNGYLHAGEGHLFEAAAAPVTGQGAVDTKAVLDAFTPDRDLSVFNTGGGSGEKPATGGKQADPESSPPAAEGNGQTPGDDPKDIEPGAGTGTSTPEWGAGFTFGSGDYQVTIKPDQDYTPGRDQIDNPEQIVPGR